MLDIEEPDRNTRCDHTDKVETTEDPEPLEHKSHLKAWMLIHMPVGVGIA